MLVRKMSYLLVNAVREMELTPTTCKSDAFKNGPLVNLTRLKRDDPTQGRSCRDKYESSWTRFTGDNRVRPA